MEPLAGIMPNAIHPHVDFRQIRDGREAPDQSNHVIAQGRGQVVFGE
jgi:hypothetical protein